jgi:hypothetical protein
MNIFSKLIEVRKSVPYLKKDTAGYQFKYVSSSQTLGALRETMDEQQLLLIPRVVKWEIRDHTTSKEKHEYFSILDMEFTWVNAEKPEETIVCSWVGCGLDDGEKGIGKAVTYAEKYFLLKFFNIATDKDDPDYFQKQQGKEEKRTPPPPPDPTKGQGTPSREMQGGEAKSDTGEAATEPQKKAIHAIAKDKGIENPRLFGIIGEQVGRPIESTSALTKREASKIIELLNEMPPAKG